MSLNSRLDWLERAVGPEPDDTADLLEGLAVDPADRPALEGYVAGEIIKAVVEAAVDTGEGVAVVGAAVDGARRQIRDAGPAAFAAPLREAEGERVRRREALATAPRKPVKVTPKPDVRGADGGRRRRDN